MRFPPAVAETTGTSPANSQRICRHAPHGGVGSSAPVKRRLLAPLLFCMALQALVYAAYSVSRQADLAISGALKWIGVAVALVIPVALLVGRVRGRVFSATSLGHLVERAMGDEVTLAHLQALLRDALGDPLLTLATRDPMHGGYVGVNGEAGDRLDILLSLKMIQTNLGDQDKSNVAQGMSTHPSETKNEDQGAEEAY